MYTVRLNDFLPILILKTLFLSLLLLDDLIYWKKLTACLQRTRAKCWVCQTQIESIPL